LVDLTYDYRGQLHIDQMPVRQVQHQGGGLTALITGQSTSYVLTRDYEDIQKHAPSSPMSDTGG
jgi:hypothetical protein